MAVGVACVRGPESGTGVLRVAPPWGGGVDVALTSEGEGRWTF